MDYIAHEVIPDIRARHEPDDVIRVWSAGCASGEEPYSLAMLFDELHLLPRVSILGTDISRYALRRASDGLYREWSLRDEGAVRAKTYLSGEGEHYRLTERIRVHVRFEYLNLALDLYPTVATGTRSLDLILCRNVLIYFGRETVKAAARRLHDSLAEGGWLMLAAGDPMIDDFAPFETIVSKHGIAYRRRMTAPVRYTELKQIETPKCSHRDTPQRSADDDEAEQLRTLSNQDTTGKLRRASPARSTPAAVKDKVDDPIEAASRALAGGDYARAMEMTETRLALPEACIISYPSAGQRRRGWRRSPPAEKQRRVIGPRPNFITCTASC